MNTSHRDLRRLVDSLPEGAFKDRCNEQLANYADRLRALPKRIANRGPFDTAEQASKVMMEECLWAVVPLDAIELMTKG